MVLACLAGCTREGDDARHALVFAAASLTEPFQELAEQFASRHPGTKVELHFAGTPQLVVQIQEGAAVDVFASADTPNMQRVEDRGHVLLPPRVFARNQLTIVVPEGNPRGIRGLEDLPRQDLKVVLCGPEVPAGRYAREALEKASLAVRTVSDEPSVKAVVSKVQLGEVDAGIVYATDAASAAGHVDAVLIPEAQNVVATYPIAVLGSGENRELAEEIVAFVLSAEGQGILRRFGFLSP